VRSHYKRAHVRKLFHRLDGWLVQRIWSHRPVVGTFYLATSDRSHRFIAILLWFTATAGTAVAPRFGGDYSLTQRTNKSASK
jgi:hypothetical protein